MNYQKLLDRVLETIRSGTMTGMRTNASNSNTEDVKETQIDLSRGL